MVGGFPGSFWRFRPSRQGPSVNQVTSRRFSSPHGRAGNGLAVSGLVTAQKLSPSGIAVENKNIDPDKITYYFVISFILVFVLLIIIALARATSALAKTLESKNRS